MIIAVDIGGTKTLVASFEEGAVITNEERFATPQDFTEFTEVLLQKLAQFPAGSIEAISIAAPGMLSPDGTLLRCGNLPWENVDLARVVSQRFPCPIYQENDANLAGLAETQALPAVPPLSLYITISTGIGTGIITHGRIDPALSNSEAGHMMLQHHGTLKQWEEIASGRAIKARFGKPASDITDPLDWQHIIHDLSIGFLALIPVLQPNVIIVGGGVGAHFDKFGGQLQQILAKELPSYIAVPPIQQAIHPNEAVIYGCYHYATHQRTA